MSSPEDLQRRWQVVLTYHGGSAKLWREFLRWQQAQYATFGVTQIRSTYQNAVQVTAAACVAGSDQTRPPTSCRFSFCHSLHLLTPNTVSEVALAVATTKKCLTGTGSNIRVQTLLWSVDLLHSLTTVKSSCCCKLSSFPGLGLGLVCYVAFSPCWQHMYDFPAFFWTCF